VADQGRDNEGQARDYSQVSAAPWNGSFSATTLQKCCKREVLPKSSARKKTYNVDVVHTTQDRRGQL
jgi:hypothetical protein